MPRRFIEHFLAFLTLYPTIFGPLQIMPRDIVKTSTTRFTVSSTLTMNHAMAILGPYGLLTLETDHSALIIVVTSHNIMVFYVKNYLITRQANNSTVVALTVMPKREALLGC